MKTDSLKYRSLKNVAYSIFGNVWTMIFAVFITPLIVFNLGLKEYGIYIFMNSLISLVGLIDLGISTAATKYVAEHRGSENQERLKSLVYSLNTLYLLIGLAGFAVFLVAGFGGQALFAAQLPTSGSYVSLFVLAGMIFFINSINSMYVIIPQAFERFDISSKVGTAQLTLSQITILILAVFHFSLSAIFISQLIYTILFSIVMFHICKKLLPFPSFRFSFDKEEIKRCYRFGIGSTAYAVTNSSLTYFDRLIIPIFLGPTQLTYYTLPGSVTSKIPGVANSLSGILFPMASSLNSAGNTDAVEKLYTRSFRLLTVLAAAMTSSVIIFAYVIMKYWLSEDFAIYSSTVLIILALTNFILALSGPLSNFLMGLGKIKLLTTLSAIMAIMNLALLALLLPRFGITGAAWAYLLSLLPVAYIFYHTEKHILGLKNRGRYYGKLGSKLAITLVLSYAIETYLLLPLVTSFQALLIIGPVSVLTFLGIYKVLGFYEKEDWDDLTTFGKLALNRIFSRKENI